jgi:hypothetical protein
MSALQKLERSYKFNPKQFNLDFEVKDEQLEQEQLQEEILEENSKKQLQEEELKKEDNDNIGIYMKNLFFKILEMLLNKENPIPYIIESERRQFTFALMILIIGGLLLFLSNLMINQSN